MTENAMKSPLLLMGVPGSPYTRKMLALLRYRHLPYELLHRDARMQGRDGDEFLRYVDSPAAATAFAVENNEAIARRVFGVPTMLLGAQMWWGNDRLFMLDQALAARA